MHSGRCSNVNVFDVTVRTFVWIVQEERGRGCWRRLTLVALINKWSSADHNAAGVEVVAAPAGGEHRLKKRAASCACVIHTRTISFMSLRRHAYATSYISCADSRVRTCNEPKQKAGHYKRSIVCTQRTRLDIPLELEQRPERRRAELYTRYTKSSCIVYRVSCIDIRVFRYRKYIKIIVY